MMFTTSTMTDPIIDWTTSGVCLGQNMAEFMDRNPSPTSRVTWREAVRRLRPGMAARKAGNGIEHSGTSTVPLPWLSRFLFSVSNAAFNMKGQLHRKPLADSVQTPASRPIAGPAGSMMNRGSVPGVARYLHPIGSAKQHPVHVSAARLSPAGRLPVCLAVDDAGRADVWCLTVPSTGCFLLANGIAVSNCADEVRYGLNSRPYVAPLPPEAREVEQDRYKRMHRSRRSGAGSAMAA
jgi:hypothetical protein